MLYNLIAPSFVFERQTAAELAGIVLIGDDFAGRHEAYDVRQNSWVFGMVGSNGRFSPHNKYSSIIDFIEAWFAKVPN